MILSKMVKLILMPPPEQTLEADVSQVIEQLERHCLAWDGSLVAKPAYYDLPLVLINAIISSLVNFGKSD